MPDRISVSGRVRLRRSMEEENEFWRKPAIFKKEK